MNPLRAIGICLLICFARFSFAATQEQADILKELQTAVLAEVTAKQADKNSPDSHGIPSTYSITFQMDMVSSVLATNDAAGDEPLRALRNVVRSEKAIALCDKLMATIDKARDEHDTAFLAAVDGAIQRLGELALQAKHDQELDPIIKELGKLRESHRTKPTPTAERENAKLDAAKRFATQWQEYLLELRMGNGRAASTKLTALASSESYPVVPRSEILARIRSAALSVTAESGGTQEMSAILARVQKLQELPAAVEQLQNLKHTNPGFVDADALGALGWIAATYQQFMEGLPVTITGEKLAIVSQKAPSRLVSQLLLLVLPRSLVTPDRKPNPDETVQGYLERIISDAKRAADWNLLLRAMRIQQMIAPQPAGSVNLTALEALLAAQNQQAAGQYSLAVASYQASLLDQSGSVPAAAVGEQLNKLRATHPKDYEEGLRLFRQKESVANAKPPRHVQ
ncbi:MAG: hypothetical protein V7609_2561 [Verrucomicrobiota bacterium]